MKRLVILGGGTAGTMMANHLIDRLGNQWSITVVDGDKTHLYQPGLLFLPFGARDEHKIVRPRKQTFKQGVIWEPSHVANLDPHNKMITLDSGHKLMYDLLIIATGTQIRPDMTPGLKEDAYYHSISDFYTLEGSLALRNMLAGFRGGHLVINILEMPIKCPVAPLEFAFLADDYFRRHRMREAVEISYVTPLDAAFTKPVAASLLGGMLEERSIHLETEFMTGEVDGDRRKIVSYDERTVDYDLLVTVPTHTGADFIEDADLGNELAFIPTDKHTLRALEMSDVFVLGDATDLPSSKAGSVAHFQAELLTENILRTINGKKLDPSFDGHSNCFVETGEGKAMLIDFNYDVEPLPGKFPSRLGPFSLLKPTRLNHLAKLAFRPTYWHGLLPARKLPLSARMSMAGKKKPA